MFSAFSYIFPVHVNVDKHLFSPTYIHGHDILPKSWLQGYHAELSTNHLC
jgi:hypothetical protein